MDEEAIGNAEAYILSRGLRLIERVGFGMHGIVFGEDWPMAKIILGDLEDLGIHMLDPSPANIRFR